MPGPLQAAGASPEPSEYAPLTMDRYITGLWTQRSPLRDADVPYLYTKFYSASRFDSLIDGLNREVTSRLTIARRPGNAIYNAAVFPPVLSFYTFKFIQNSTQVVKVIADTAATIYDATAGQQSALYTKTAGAGKTRFQGVGGTLFFGDGKEQKKLLEPNVTWSANTAFTAGQYIIDPNGNLQVITAQNLTLNLESLQVVLYQPVPGGATSYQINVVVDGEFPPLAASTPVTFAGLTNYPTLNGKTLLTVVDPATAQTDQLHFSSPGPAYGPAGETGNATFIADANGTSGAVQPAWSLVLGSYTQDGTVSWRNFGKPVFDWATPAPTLAPTVSLETGRQWAPNISAEQYTTILDTNGNLQVALNATGGVYKTGTQQPTWKTGIGAQTSDGTIFWTNLGVVGSWVANYTEPTFAAILDTNGNLQYAQTQTGMTGATEPVWNTAGTTADNGVTWMFLGAGTELTTASQQYAYAYHSIDGSVTTASPVTTLSGGVLGPGSQFRNLLSAPTTADPICDQIWIFRTVQGGSTLLLLAQIPNPTLGVVTTWNYQDMQPDSALNLFIQAPIADANDPPPAGATAPAYHVNRLWVVVNDIVSYSGGPDVLTGNGNTAFPPLNSFVFPETITRLIPFTVDNGGLLVLGTANVYVILGTGTSANPFYTTTYMPTVGFLSYDAIDIVGSTIYGLTNNSKFISLDPSAGYVECGFPIGDQFQTVTTGGIDAALYNPATAYVAWNERSSGDSGLYVSDGAVGWFRYSPVASPESGFLWSPRAVIVGGTSAVQNVETVTGMQRLLIGPPSGGGPILQRSNTVWTDNGQPYAESYLTIGNIVLCESGEIAEVAHVALDSIRTGAEPTVGLLFGEIAETATSFFDSLHVTSPDPPDLPESETLFSSRYVVMQNGYCPKCRHCQLKISWPAQAVGDELLSHAIYGAKWAERRQQ
jgi:hypothetical protein